MAPDTDEAPPDLELQWELPRGWSQTRSTAQASVTAQGPVALARPPRITATLETVTEPLNEWWSGLDEVLPQALEGFQLLDSGSATVAGLPGVRRLVHYRGRDSVPTILEQWAAQDERLRIVIMATLSPRNYDGTADAVVALVAGARVTPREKGASS